MKPHFALLASLYVGQYLGLSFFNIGLIAILRDRGATLGQIAAVETVAVFWIIKPLWAPLVDRIGSYRRWLLVLQPVLAGLLLLATPLDPMRNLSALVVIVGAVAFLSATQDIATDGLAVRILADAGERGIGNGIQTAGGYVGGVLGGGLTLVVYDQFGWQAAMVALAVSTLLPTLLIARSRELPRVRAVGKPSLRSVFRRRGVVRWLLILLPCSIGLDAGYALVKPMLVDMGWSLTSVGVAFNAAGGLVGIAFGIAVGFVVARLSRRSTLFWIQLTHVPVVLLLALAWSLSSSVLVFAAAMAIQAVMAASMTITCAIAMDLSGEDSAGTDFTVIISVAMFVSIVGGAVLTAVAGAIGYAPTLVGAAAIAGVGAGVIRRYYLDTSAAAIPEPVRADRTRAEIDTVAG